MLPPTLGKQRERVRRDTKSAKKSPKFVLKSPKSVKAPRSCKNVDTSIEPDLPTIMDFTDTSLLPSLQLCQLALVNSGFYFLDTTQYDQWFGDESILFLSETGFYKGAKDIAEYAAFVNNDYLSEYYVQPSIATQYIPLSVVDNECTFSVMAVNSMVTNPDVIGRSEEAVSIDTVGGMRWKFSITDRENVTNPQTIRMHRVEVYYPPGFVSFLFGEKLATRGTAEYICDAMINNCASIFQLTNGYSSIDECAEDLLNLPGSEDDYIDGKSMGCRALHAAFAATNKKHCPHISTAPVYDENCFLKCQESKNHAVEDFFLPEELQLYADYSKQQAGLGETQWVSPSIYHPLPVSTEENTN